MRRLQDRQVAKASDPSEKGGQTASPFQTSLKKHAFHSLHGRHVPTPGTKETGASVGKEAVPAPGRG